jgi:hypothetical protein
MKIEMMVVPVYERQTTLTTEVPKHLYDAYNLREPGKASVSIPCDEADKKMNEWKRLGYGYAQRKWFLYQELISA